MSGRSSMDLPPQGRSLLRMWIAAAGATCIANATWWMQPLLMHDLVANHGYGEARAGLAISVEMAAMALGSALIARLSVGRSLLMIALAGVAAAIAGSLITLQSTAYVDFLLSRALTGLGMGATLMVSNTVAAAFPNPDRTFGQLNVANLVFGVVLLAAAPMLREFMPDVSPYFVILASVAIMLVPIAFLQPAMRVTPHHAPVGDDAAPRRTANVLMLCAITLLVGLVSGIIWAFYALIGEQAGLSSSAVDAAISFSVFTAMIAAGLVAVLGTRFGRIVPVSLAMLTVLVAIVIMSAGPGPLMFRIATCLNISALYFLLPYLLGAAAAQDTSGRSAAYVGSVFFFTGAISPVLGGLLAVTIGMGIVGIAAVLIVIVSIVLIVRVERSTPPHALDFSREGPVQALHPATPTAETSA